MSKHIDFQAEYKNHKNELAAVESMRKVLNNHVKSNVIGNENELASSKLDDGSRALSDNGRHPSCSLPVVCLNQFNKAWLNFDLGEVRTVSSVITTGRPGHNQWVKKYTISVSDDGSTFIDAPCLDKDSNGYCNGNTDMTTQVTNVLAGTTKARYVRLNVKENNGYSSLRMAVSMEKKPIKEYEFRTVDCSSSDCKGEPPAAKWKNNGGSAGEGQIVVLDQCKNGWLQLDLGEVRTVSSVVTSGRPVRQISEWVTKYTVSVSDDGSTFTKAPCVNHDSNGYCNGNSDATTQVTNVLADTIKARYVRLNVKACNRYPSLKMSVSIETKSYSYKPNQKIW